LKIFNKLKNISKIIKQEVSLYRKVLKDPRTPLIPKILLFLAVGYLFLPFDLVPDFIPVFGQIDDIIIVPLLVYIAVKLIPNEIIDEHRNLL